MQPLDVLPNVLIKGHAYLDPSSGSFILQILLAALLGGGYAVKVYWKKIKAFFTGHKEDAGLADDLIQEEQPRDGE